MTEQVIDEAQRSVLVYRLSNLVGERYAHVAEVLSYFPGDADDFIKGQQIIHEMNPDKGPGIYFGYNRGEGNSVFIRAGHYHARDILEASDTVAFVRGEGDYNDNPNLLPPRNEIVVTLWAIKLRNDLYNGKTTGDYRLSEPETRSSLLRVLKTLYVLNVTPEEEMRLLRYAEANASIPYDISPRERESRKIANAQKYLRGTTAQA